MTRNCQYSPYKLLIFILLHYRNTVNNPCCFSLPMAPAKRTPPKCGHLSQSLHNPVRINTYLQHIMISMGHSFIGPDTKLGDWSKKLYCTRPSWKHITKWHLTPVLLLLTLRKYSTALGYGGIVTSKPFCCELCTERMTRSGINCYRPDWIHQKYLVHGYNNHNYLSS